MPRRTVKAEPHAPAPSAVTVTEVPSSMEAEPSPQQPRNSRFARSGAPSVDTRLGRRTIADVDSSANGPVNGPVNGSVNGPPNGPANGPVNGTMSGVNGSSNGGGGATAGDDDENILIMEVRQIKSQPSETIERLDHLPIAPHGHGHANGASHPNVSFVSHGFTAIGDKVKELNDTLGELQSLGIQHVASLPELVLVGDQSAGKSSLMSSFSGIYLPRSEGACTRCPVHIRLSGSQGGGPWSCRVSLQQDYDYSPSQTANVRVTRDHPFGPWKIKRRRDIKDFAILSDPAEIEETLRWAQLATLNPNQDHSFYKPNSGKMWRRYHHLDGLDSGADDLIDNQAAFSPNTVALDISAPDLADLSFYDLPGVFTSARRDEDQYLVKVVENLTAKYIEHKQAIILWAVPMNADPETSSTFSIIRRLRAQSRTIGIMTKADLLPPDPGASSQWMAMLRGQQHLVGHGYFMTARPVVTQDLISDELVQSSSSHQRRDPSRPADELERQGAFEEAFFNRQLPGTTNQEWRDCFRDFEDRCGISRLVSFMSQQLGTEFSKCLPQIKEKVTSRLEQVEKDLGLLPDMPENPELEVRRGLAEFAALVRSSLEGPDLSLPITGIIRRFQQEITRFKPRYIVKLDGQHPGAAGNSAATMSSAVSALSNGGGALNGINGSGGMSVSRIDLTNDNDDAASMYSQSPAPGLGPPPPPSVTDGVGASGAGGGGARRRVHGDFLEGRHDASGPSTPSKRPRVTGTLPEDIKAEDMPDYLPSPSTAVTGAGRVLFQDQNQSRQAAASRPGGPYEPQRLPLSRRLQDVRDIINAKSKPGMPDIVSDDVYTSLCMEAVMPWKLPLEQLIDEVFRLLASKLDELLNRALSGLQGRLIVKESARILSRFLGDRRRTLRATLVHQYTLETRKLYTLNDELLKQYDEDEGRILARHRHHYRMLAYLGQNGQNSQAAQNRFERAPPRPWEAMGEEERVREKAVMDQELAKLGPDPYKKELDVCAYVRAYYRTASTRFIDMCTLHVVSGLLPDIVDALSKWYVDSALGVFDRTVPQTFLDLMDEDAATASRRASLKEDRERFVRTMESIQRLENRVEGGDGGHGGVGVGGGSEDRGVNGNINNAVDNNSEGWEGQV